MASRRKFLVGSVAPALGFLAGCSAIEEQLSSSDDSSGDGADSSGSSAAGTGQEYRIDAYGNLLVAQESFVSFSVEATANPGDAQEVVVRKNGRHLTTLREQTTFREIDGSAAQGDHYRMIARYPDGTEDVLAERCIECGEGTTGGSTTGGDSTTGSDDGFVDPDPDPAPISQEIADTRRTISEDEYIYWEFDLDRTATVSYEFFVRDGPETDVFLVDESEFAEFEAQNRFRAYSNSAGTSGSDSATLGPGTYHLVIDNTNAGPTSPPTNFDDDYAEVEITADIEG